MSRRHHIAVAQSLYKSISRSPYCTYCGLRATTIDHVVPISIVARTIGLLDFKNKLIVPACLECNLIASDKLFKTIGAKRRYIQARLRIKYKRILACPVWHHHELDELTEGHFRDWIAAGYQQRKQMERRVAWRNYGNPENVVIAKKTLKPGGSAARPQRNSVPVHANNVGTTKPGGLFSLQMVLEANGGKLSKVDHEFVRNVVKEFGSGCLYEIIAMTRPKKSVEEEIAEWRKERGKGRK